MRHLIALSIVLLPLSAFAEAPAHETHPATTVTTTTTTETKCDCKAKEIMATCKATCEKENMNTAATEHNAHGAAATAEHKS